MSPTTPSTDTTATAAAVAIAERYAAGWTPDADNTGHPVWLAPTDCGSRGPAGRPEPMPAEQAAWFRARGWSFAISNPANQVKLTLQQGLRPVRVAHHRWRLADVATGRPVPYRRVTPEQLRVYAGGAELTDDELEALFETHRHDRGDAYDAAGVPWLRGQLGAWDDDPTATPIPWPPATATPVPSPPTRPHPTA